MNPLEEMRYEAYTQYEELGRVVLSKKWFLSMDNETRIVAWDYIEHLNNEHKMELYSYNSLYRIHKLGAVEEESIGNAHIARHGRIKDALIRSLGNAKGIKIVGDNNLVVEWDGEVNHEIDNAFNMYSIDEIMQRFVVLCAGNAKRTRLPTSTNYKRILYDPDKNHRLTVGTLIICIDGVVVYLHEKNTNGVNTYCQRRSMMTQNQYEKHLRHNTRHR